MHKVLYLLFAMLLITSCGSDDDTDVFETSGPMVSYTYPNETVTYRITVTALLNGAADVSITKEYKVTKAVIPVAGLGTRFLPATKAMPKEMLPLIDKPVIQYVVEEAVAAGIKDVLFVTGRNKDSLENHFDRSR